MIGAGQDRSENRVPCQSLARRSVEMKMHPRSCRFRQSDNSPGSRVRFHSAASLVAVNGSGLKSKNVELAMREAALAGHVGSSKGDELVEMVKNARTDAVRR